MSRVHLRNAFVLSYVAASLDAMKRTEIAEQGKKTAFVNRIEALEDGVNRALEKLPPTMRPDHAVSEQAAVFFARMQGLLDEVLGEGEGG
jgi:hypothetical protein